jgi:arginyl-tRNA synthetase
MLAKPQGQPASAGRAAEGGLLATPAFGQWVDAIEIAGPAF